MKKKTSKNNTVFIMSSFFPVGLEDYVENFKGRFDTFYYLKWKFPHSKDRKSFSSITEYKNGKLVREQKLYSWPNLKNKMLYFLVLPINYLTYLCQAFCLGRVRRSSNKVVFMGINYYCTFCGIILKKFGMVDFVIYRVMDFFPLPPSGFYRFLNRIFYKFDEFCLRKSDSIWFTTEGHIIGREKYGYFDRSKYPYEIIPLGMNRGKFVSAPSSKSNKHSLIYCGVVSRYHMLDLMFEALKDLKNEFTDIKFNIIGTGPDLDYFKKLAKDLNLEKQVVFYGYMEEGYEFNKIMSNNALGVALYRDEENFMKYTEPAKVKYYLNYGVPALISKVPQIAFELDKRKISFAVENSKIGISNVIREYFKNDKMQAMYKDNLKEFLDEVEVNKLLDEKFNNIDI